MTTLTEILDFVRAHMRYRGELAADASLQDDLRMYGADVQEFMEEYAKTFGVDMSSYLWYFHTGDEASLILEGCSFHLRIPVLSRFRSRWRSFDVQPKREDGSSDIPNTRI